MRKGSTFAQFRLGTENVSWTQLGRPDVSSFPTLLGQRVEWLRRSPRQGPTRPLFSLGPRSRECVSRMRLRRQVSHWRRLTTRARTLLFQSWKSFSSGPRLNGCTGRHLKPLWEVMSNDQSILFCAVEILAAIT